MKTVNDMYIYSKENGLYLLSNFNAEFWQEYIDNHDKYDLLFRRYYYSFKPFLQKEEDDISIVTNSFIEEVYNHLLVNKRKYEQLYRVYIIADEKNSLTDNYDMIETMKRQGTQNSDNTYGRREDNSNYIKGNQNNDRTQKVTTYDSDVYNDNEKFIVNEGERTDNEVSIKGEQKDNLSVKNNDEYTLTKKGNIGVQTVTDMITKHNKFWSGYRFYTKIFEDICSELLIV